jgi:tRNA(fMet)-specific endonuclease VapC
LLLFDTNHCFRIVAREPAFLARLQSLSTEHVVTSVIVAGELRYGASISQRKDENLSSVEQFLDAMALIPITGRIAAQYGALKAALLEKFGPRERAPAAAASIWQRSDSAITISGLPLLRCNAAQRSSQRIQTFNAWRRPWRIST